MPNFLENIFAQLRRSADRVVLREIRGEQFVSVTGGELLDLVQRVRGNLRGYGLEPGDRSALLAANSIRWVSRKSLRHSSMVVLPVPTSPVRTMNPFRLCTP